MESVAQTVLRCTAAEPRMMSGCLSLSASAEILRPTCCLIMPKQGDPYELYKQQFDERYDGNRAPLGIFIHAAWLIADPT